MNSHDDLYTTIATSSEGIYRDKGSKFLAYAWHIDNESEVKKHIEFLKKAHPSARHFCYAFRINPENEYWRANDDGEPSGSAGKPILGQIKSFNLQETLVVVVRYFGGTLLGVPGLIQAYKQATIEALEHAKKETRIISRMYKLSAEYSQLGDLMKFLKDNHIEYDSPLMGSIVQIDVRIPKSKSGFFETIFVEKNWLMPG